MAQTPTGRVQPFSTGSAYVWLGLGNGKSHSPLFFGTCEGYPKHERRPDYMPLMNDVAGRRKAMDMAFQGQDATISLSMTVWDEGMYEMLQQFPDFTGNTGLGTPGAYRFSDVGSLMGFEQFAIPVWIVYNFGGAAGMAAKAAYVGGGLPSGYRYLQCIPFAPDTADEGAQPMIRHIMFYSWPVCNFQTGIFTLYDGNMTGLITPFSSNAPVAA